MQKGFLTRDKMKQYKIPPELVFNSNQTLSSYICFGWQVNYRSQGFKSNFKGITDKRAITLNFVITLSNKFLPMQVIYSGKTNASQPHKGFCIAQNPQHWLNETKPLRW